MTRLEHKELNMSNDVYRFRTNDGYVLTLVNGVWTDGDLTFQDDMGTPVDVDGVHITGRTLPTEHRYCEIESASVEDKQGGGDGAYGLLDVTGGPEDIGQAIAFELAEGDMTRGPTNAYIADMDDELFLTVRIRFAAHELITEETEEEEE